MLENFFIIEFYQIDTFGGFIKINILSKLILLKTIFSSRTLLWYASASEAKLAGRAKDATTPSEWGTKRRVS